jgi:hypothetical protein
MSDLPIRSFDIGGQGFDVTLGDRALIRACYRYYSDMAGREVARWEAMEMAYHIQRIRLSNMDSNQWRKEMRNGEI